MVAVALTVGVSLLAAELAARLVDGYALTPRLVVSKPKQTTAAQSPDRKWLARSDAEYYVARLATAEGVDRAWFMIDPAPLPDR